MNIKSRRLFLKTSIIGGVLGFFTNSVSGVTLTPSDSQGPFYPITPQKDKDFDLTTIKGQQGTAIGEIINIRGKVLDENLKPLEDVTIDLWQANAAGRYHHPYDTSKVPLDENFQGWAIIQSGVSGGFNFKTIVPGAYAASSSWTRPPHIHFKISKLGYHELLTQMYFPDNELNQKDYLLQSKSTKEQELMIAKKVEGSSNTLQYTIILRSI